MAVAGIQGEQLNTILQCSICIDVFTDPRTLPCLHTFCIKCIADWCKNKQPGGKVTCPECREEFVIPDSGIDGLKKNFFITNMLSMNEVEQKTGDVCEICVGDNKNVSEMFCLQCEQSYCEPCSKAHLKMKVSSSHKLVRLDELQSGIDVNKKFRSQYCDKHSDKLIEFYCLDDEVAICMTCCVLNHRFHRCEEMKKIANQFRSGKWKQDLQNALSEVEEKFVILNSKKLNFIDKIKIAENEICEEADNKIQLIMNHKQKLVSSLQNIKTHHEEEINKVNQELTRAKALLSTFKDYCDELLQKGSDVDICQEKSSLSRKAEELIKMKDLEDSLEKLSIADVIFSASRLSATFEDTKSTLGELKAVKSGVFKESEEKVMLQGTSTVTDNPQLLFSIDQPSNGDSYSRQVSGVAMLDKYLCVVYNKYNTVHVFSCKDRFKKIKDIQINEMRSAIDIVGCSVTSQLFVSDCFNGNIWRVNVNTGVCDVFIKLDCNNARLSLADNRLLVTSPDSLLMYDIHSGQRMKNIPYTEDMKKYGVIHAIESNRNSIFVSHGQSNGRTNTVSEIDSRGRMIRVFDNKEQLYCCNLSLDSVGRLLVVDWNDNSVVLLDEHLQFITILFDKERLEDAQPLRLSYNKNNNRLVVGLNNGHVMIFDCQV